MAAAPRADTDVRAGMNPTVSTIDRANGPHTCRDGEVAPPTIGLFANLPAGCIGGLDAAARILGATVHSATAAAPAAQPHAAWLIGAQAVGALDDASVAALRRAIQASPVLLFPESAQDAPALVDACASLRLQAPVLSGPARTRRYRFASSARWLEPFDGEEIAEDFDRHLHVLSAPDPAAALISGYDGAVFVRLGDHIFLTTQPPLTDFTPDSQLRWKLHPGDFLELLPLLLFMRRALGSRAWRAVEATATFMIDDPNLRRPRYGFADFQKLAAEGHRHGFHTAIATSPIDLCKTRSRTAALFRGDAELSLVLHGVHHSKHEFAQHVDDRTALRRLSAGWAWALRHARGTGVECPPVMTLPYERVNRDWLDAMRASGLTAAIATSSFAFVDQTVLRTTHELLPAETGHRGFPILTRLGLNVRLENLLFQRFLGKPLIVYGHHYDYRAGLDRFLQVADYVNRAIGARWCGLAAIAASNYQVRSHGDALQVRAFSNRIALPSAVALNTEAAWKHGAPAFSDERAWIMGDEATVAPVLDVRPRAATVSPADVELVFGVRRLPLGDARSVRPPGPYLRRLLAEGRDRTLPARARLREGARFR